MDDAHTEGPTRQTGGWVRLLPFCACMHKPDYEGGKPMGAPFLGWGVGEYDVLDDAQVYDEVFAHRRVCRLLPDLFPETAG